MNKHAEALLRALNEHGEGRPQDVYGLAASANLSDSDDIDGAVRELKRAGFITVDGRMITITPAGVARLR